MSNYSNFTTQKNQTINKTKQELNFQFMKLFQDAIRGLIAFIKQMIAAVLGK